MCYTGMCKYENWQGDCRASSAQRAKDCFLSDDYETEQEEQEDEDAESTDAEDAEDATYK